MLAPHRRVPNRAREIRERINALVRSRIGPGIICGKCGASYTTMAERCEADLGEACPGEQRHQPRTAHRGARIGDWSRMSIVSTPWSDGEVSRLLRLRAADASWDAIARRLPGRTVAACMEKYQWLKRKSRGPKTSAGNGADSGHEHAAADRDRRAAISPRSLTAAIFGDPLPGYSALERRISTINTPATRRPNLEA